MRLHDPEANPSRVAFEVSGMCAISRNKIEMLLAIYSWTPSTLIILALKQQQLTRMIYELFFFGEKKRSSREKLIILPSAECLWSGPRCAISTMTIIYGSLALECTVAVSKQARNYYLSLCFDFTVAGLTDRLESCVLKIYTLFSLSKYARFFFFFKRVTSV